VLDGPGIKDEITSVSDRNKLRQWAADLTRTETAVLIALILRIVYPASIPGSLLVRVFFLVALIFFFVFSFPAIARHALWRVRYRLLVTWIFVGVVPIILICALALETGYMMLGQIVSYMTTNEVVRESESVRNAASTLLWSLEHGSSTPVAALTETFVKETSAARHTEIGVIVRGQQNVTATPDNGSIAAIPKWSRPDTFGLVKDDEKKRYYFVADAGGVDSKDGFEVFVYEPASPDFFARLLPNVASVRPVEGNANATGIEIGETPRSQSGITFNSGKADPDMTVLHLPPPPGRGWWDREVDWVALMPKRDLASGKGDEPAIALVTSRPSLILKKLFSTLGTPAVVVIVITILTSIVLLIVEMISAFVGFKLTRSITRAVADLYEGTRKAQAGNFSHRIPVRKTKDQLSELGSSFNAMTARIEDLISEVKEKQRLEKELEIAREVQSQLFPKELPQLKTLQLWGGCQPARTVSGDYYDFVSLSMNAAALAIGDISGKGISAALLMAHIQSALRTQMEDWKDQSPATILSILNNHLYKSSPPEKYATFFLGLYSDEASQLLYTNAGHPAPMLVRKGEVLRLPGEGLPVGLFPGIEYDQQTIGLNPGDVLVAFTDGVTEAPNRDGEEFGDQRVMELLVR